MMKSKEEHKRKSMRLKDYDYSQVGAYFVTICIKNRRCLLGNVVNSEIVLNKYSKIVNQQWLWLRIQYPYVKLDEFVIMPNHLHGIIIIDCESVGTGRDLSLQKIKSLSELIGVFKTTSSKLIHRAGLQKFSWQRSFYEHIIRNEKSLNKIRQYIVNNPLSWELDIENPEKRKDYKSFTDYLKLQLK